MADSEMRTLTGPDGKTREIVDAKAREKIDELEQNMGVNTDYEQRISTLESTQNTLSQTVGSHTTDITQLKKDVQTALDAAQSAGSAADGMTFNPMTGVLQLTSGGVPIEGASATIKLSDYYTKTETEDLIDDAVASMAGSEAITQIAQQAVGSVDWDEENRKLTLYNTVGDYLDEIVIEGGGGGTGEASYSLRIINGQSSTSLTVASTSKTKLKVSFVEKYGADSTGQNGKLDVEYKLSTDTEWTKLGDTKEVPQNVEFEVDPSNILTVGKITNVRMTVTGGESGLSRSLTFNITSVEAKISAVNFDDTATYTGNLSLQYRCSGRGLTKTVHFEMDGTEIVAVDIGTSHNETRSQAITLVGVYEYGSHDLRVWYTTPDGAVSNTLLFSVLYNDGSSSAPIIGAVCEPELTYGDNMVVRYVLDTPGAETTAELSIRVYALENDDEVEYATAELANITDNTAFEWLNSFYPEVGKVYIELTSGTTKKLLSLMVNEIVLEDGMSLDSIKTGLVYSYSPIGRSNNDASRSLYKNPYKTAAGVETTIHGRFKDFNWVSDGYLDGEALTISGEARHEIELPIFSTSYVDSEGQDISLESAGNAQVTTNGRTIEIELMASNVTDSNAQIVKCMSAAGTGFVITPQVVYLLSANGTGIVQDETGFVENEENIPCAYIKDQERVRISFVIEPLDAENNRQCINIYINGEYAKSQPYDSDTRYNSDEFITFGSDTCITKVYDVKIYNRGLSRDEVMQNYLVSPRSVTDKIDRLEKNDLLDDNGKVSYAEARIRYACLLTIGRQPAYKGDKQKVGAILTFPDGLGGYITKFALLEKDKDGNFICELDVQGTSSQKFIRKNGKIKLKIIAKGTDGLPVLELDENGVETGHYVTEKYKHSLKGQDAEGNDLSIPESTLCYKIDYMSPDHPNTFNANMVDAMFEEKTIAQGEDTRVQNCIWGHRCLWFTTSAEEWPNGEIVFAGDGCLNNDKSNTATFGLEVEGDEDNRTTRQKWEFLNNTNAIGFFKTDRLFEPVASGGYQVVNAIESTYPDQGDLEDEGLTPDYEHVQILWTWVCQRANFWDASTEPAATPYTYKGAKYTTERAWKKAIFLAEFGLHFKKSRAMTYYVFGDTVGLSDNWVKNMFIRCEDVHADKLAFTDSSVTSIFDLINPDTGAVDASKIDWENSEFAVWLVDLYDLDCCFGKENSGYIRIPYYAKRSYQLGGVNQFNGYDSNLWLMVEEAFPADIKAEAQRLDSAGLLNYDALHRIHITENAELVSPVVVNADMDYKYSDPWTEGYWDYSESIENPKWVQSSQYKYLQRGSLTQQKDAWMYKRCQLKSSEWQTQRFINNVITFRAGQNVEAADSTITIKAMQALYPGVKYGDTGTNIVGATEMIPAGTPCEIINSQRIGRSDTVYIYGGTNLIDIGDLSKFCPYEIQLSKGEKLRVLTIGSDAEGYENTSLSGLDLSSCVLLEELNISGCTSLTQTIDMSKNTLIRRIYAANSFVPYLKLPEGGVLEELRVGSVSNLTVLSMGSLSSFGCDSLDRLTCLRVENTPNIPVLDIVRERLPYLTDGLRLVGIDVDVGDDMEIFKILCSDNAKGKYLDNNGVLSTSKTAYPVITGTIHCSAIGSVLLGQMNTLYPDLVIDYGQVVTQHAIRFQNYDGAEIETQYLTPGSMPEDPVTRAVNPVPVPTQPMSDSSIFTYAGWSPAINVVTGDAIYTATYTSELRTFTLRWYNGSELKQEKTYKYGDEAVYEGDEPEDHTLDQYFIYRLFSHWDKCTSYVTCDMDIHAVFDEASAPKKTTHPDWSLATATPIQLHAMIKTGVLASNGGFNAQSSNADYYGMVSSKDEFDLVMGNDCDDYSNVENVEIVPLDSPMTFDGTSYHNTKLKLFDEDKSFTLAIDFAYGTTESDKVLLSCCSSSNGVLMKYTSSGAMVYYGGASASAAVAKQINREMLVLRHRKGDPNLYIYSSNKTGSAVLVQTIKRTAITQHNSELVFGCQYESSDGYTDNFAKGTIYWAKLWYADLGEELSSDLAVWPRETLTMQAAGVSEHSFRLHPISGETGQYCACAFLMKNLMQATRQMNPTNTNSGGWPASAMRDWLNNRLYYALPKKWRRIIRAVDITSTSGNMSTDSFVTSSDYVWLPSCKEVGGYTTTAGYASEGNGTINFFTDDTSRIKALNNGEGAVSSWWLRSPSTASATSFCNVGTSGWYGYYYGAGYSYGVCFGFCI